MHTESVRIRASAATHWCMHGVFIMSGCFLRITASAEVISRSSVQAGCPLTARNNQHHWSLCPCDTKQRHRTVHRHTYYEQRHLKCNYIITHKVHVHRHARIDTYTNNDSISPIIQTALTFYTTLYINRFSFFLFPIYSLKSADLTMRFC